MFSTQTPTTPPNASASTSTSLSGGHPLPRRLERDVNMKDGGTAGGRKGTSRIKAHRMKGSGIDLYKDKGPIRSSLAARANAVDPEGRSISMRGAADRERSRATGSGATLRPRRDALSTVLREAVGSPVTAKVMDVWKEFIHRRYNAEMKFLNLENMAQDEILKKNNITPPGHAGASYREGAVIFKLASKLEPEVQTISLASNGIKYLAHFSTLNTYLPKLANLSMQNNLIAEFSELDKISGRGTKVSLLRELVLSGNPIRDRNDESHYKSEVNRRFPMLEMLDQSPIQKISFDVSSSVSRLRSTSLSSQKTSLTTFPFPMGPNGMADAHQEVVGKFLTQFFSLFDSDRTGAQLHAAYAENATFSYSANTSIPIRARIEGHHTSKAMPNQVKLEWKAWLDNSRNLLRVGKSLEKARKTLVQGSTRIVGFLTALPRTRHVLVGEGAGERWSLDAWPVDDMMAGGGTCLLVCVRGQFTEEPSMGERSFDRSFMLAAAPDGSLAKQHGWDVVILSDQLVVRNYSSHLAWKVGPMKVVSDEHCLEGLTDPQKILVRQLAEKSNLTLPYALQCLASNAWDVERAWANFEQVRGQLPAEAWNVVS